MDQRTTPSTVQPGEFYREDDELPLAAVEALQRRTAEELRELAAKVNRKR